MAFTIYGVSLLVWGRWLSAATCVGFFPGQSFLLFAVYQRRCRSFAVVGGAVQGAVASRACVECGGTLRCPVHMGRVSDSIRDRNSIGEIYFFAVLALNAPPLHAARMARSIERGTEVVVIRYERGIAYVRAWDQDHSLGAVLTRPVKTFRAFVFLPSVERFASLPRFPFANHSLRQASNRSPTVPSGTKGFICRTRLSL